MKIMTNKVCYNTYMTFVIQYQNAYIQKVQYETAKYIKCKVIIKSSNEWNNKNVHNTGAS